jgi:RHS repeat-associated protein
LRIIVRDNNDQDRLIQQAGVNYTFDDDGYLTQRGSDTFTYSARGELLNATVGGQTATYQYDGMGRRIGKTDTLGTVQYLYGDLENPFRVTASRGPDNAPAFYYYDDYDTLYAFDRNGMRYYVASDHLGTPKVITDNVGNVVNVVTYDAFGVKLSDSNPSLNFPIGFAGGIADGITPLVRYGYRDYEPGTGRWVARDPILFEGDLNLYVYVGNGPATYIDPSGLTWIYQQSTGRIYHQPDTGGPPAPLGTGYSGGGTGLNNPAMQNTRNVGPIPQGNWTIGPQQTNVTNIGRRLPGSMRVTPAPGTTNRTGFLIHGGDLRRRNSSTGCIVLPPRTRNRIGTSGDRNLTVVP